MKNTNKIAANILIRRGWNVYDINHDNANGYDLTIAKNNKSYRVEVKLACFSSRSIKTTPLGKSGLKSDAVAILFRDKETLLLLPTKDFIKMTGKSGHAFITDFYRMNS